MRTPIINQHNLKVGDVFSALRPNLTKYNFIKLLRIEELSFGWKRRTQYVFSGSDDRESWHSEMRMDFKRFKHAYEAYIPTIEGLAPGQIWVRNNPEKGQIVRVEVLDKDNGTWKIKLMEKFAEPWTKDDKFIPRIQNVMAGFFKEFRIDIKFHTNRLVDIE